MGQMITLYGDKYELDHYVLKRLLKRSGLDEQKFRKVPLDDPFLYQYGDKVIVTLGDAPLKRLTGEHDSFRWFNRVIVLKDGTYIIPNLLPSSLLPFKDFDAESDEDSRRHPPRLHGIVCGCFRRAEEISREGYTPQRDEFYLEDPTPLQFEKWTEEFVIANPQFLSFDIETNYSTRKHSEEDYDESEYDKEILRISFSYQSHHAVSIPFSPEYYPAIRTLLEHPCMKIVWNGRTFDVPILNYNGFTVNGTLYDVMDGWHFIQSDLEKGLEFVSGIMTDILPWKHLNNAKPAYYSCIDADAALQIGIKIYDQLNNSGLWNNFYELGIECMHYLDIAGRNGNYIDKPAQDELRIILTEKKKQISVEIQDLIPTQLKPRSVYKKQPESFDYTEPYATEVKCCANCREVISNKSEHQKGKGNPCKGADTYVTQGFKTQFVKIDDFNPNSTQQVIGYIKHFNHPMGKNHKTGSETADTKHLNKLNAKFGKKHPIYAKIIEMHKISKALSTYVEGLKPDSNGKIYTTYVNAPSTWRLSSRNCNVQNQGKRAANPYAKKARKTIIAPEGYSIVQADSSSIEAVMVGYFMNDEHYLNIARQSIHAYVACKKLGFEFTKENIDRVKKDYATLYDQFKVTNHMTNYGGTPSMLFSLFPDLFPTRKAASEAQQFIFDVLPNLPKWHYEIRTRAQKEGYLQNPFGIRHYFYDVFTYQTTPNGSIIYGTDGLPKVKLGKDAKRSIAFLPQSSAGCFARQNIVRIGKIVDPSWLPAILTVHDSYALVVPDKEVDKAINILYTILTRPIPEMGNLTIGCEVEVGKNWAEMEKVSI